MSTNKKKTPEMERAFAKLQRQGKTQKEIAAIIGISEKSACMWAKNTPAAKYQKQIAGLQKRIESDIKRNAPAEEIVKLADAILKLEKALLESLRGIA